MLVLGKELVFAGCVLVCQFVVLLYLIITITS